MSTPIHKMHYRDETNIFYVKRDDLLPFSFGGNKYRKALLYFEEILENDYDTVITVGSASSNHCRIIANLAKKHQLDCYIIIPKENDKPASNKTLMKILSAHILTPNKSDIKATINQLISNLKSDHKKPYYIKMGGHGVLGTQAYKEAFEEIYRDAHYPFDYIFLATGTGTTQAGLVVGQALKNTQESIVGISVLSSYEDGFKHVLESVVDYFKEKDVDLKIPIINLVDDYLAGGYGKSNDAISEIIKTVFRSDGIALDPTYTGKSFLGMLEYLKNNQIKHKKILFLHTGGAPIFFDALESIEGSNK